MQNLAVAIEIAPSRVLVSTPRLRVLGDSSYQAMSITGACWIRMFRVAAIGLGFTYNDLGLTGMQQQRFGLPPTPFPVAAL
ncbi:hypothetical protein [Paracoccus benzoatiresistens]|uniref:Uncharacterized protein n=1 Tax=Paracoccus benzoatiresistens TaxID=2997341 RepID=A0ABT4JBT5_9RHOB|nr:hypothetical protein [Paracoccus sp. EF6]MCZ0964032.1 hypothetical protein [Paracoccus sp. EF6]